MKRPTNFQLLIQAGRNYVWQEHDGGPGVKSLLTGKPTRFLQEHAIRQARYQAYHETQGHQNWSQRSQEILSQLPAGFRVEENAAESWPENSRVEAATEMFFSWERSPGHWELCNQRCIYFGINMSKGKNGIYYSTLLVAWK